MTSLQNRKGTFFVSDYRSYRTCQHVMTTGRLCQCPAIKSTSFCVNHTGDRQRRRNLDCARQLKRARSADSALDELNAEIFESLQLPALEEVADIPVVLSNTLHLIGGGHISVRAAEAIVSACRIAGITLRSLEKEAGKGGIQRVEP
jgi:hypothetical protein